MCCFFAGLQTSILSLRESRDVRPGEDMRLAQCFDSQHYRRPHPSANASDLPVARGGDVEIPNANGRFETPRPPRVRVFT